MSVKVDRSGIGLEDSLWGRELIPLITEELGKNTEPKDLEEALQTIVNNFFAQKMNELTQAERKSVELELKKQTPGLIQAIQGLAEARRIGNEGRKGVEEGRRLQEQGRRRAEEGRRLQEEARQGLEQIAKERQAIVKERQEHLTQQFYSIFNRTPISQQEINIIFQKYLEDGSLSVEKNKEGASYPRINSMKAVTKYLGDHLTVLACDFRSFKTEVHDVRTLTEYLKTSTVKAIAVKKCISEEAKASLAEAVAARNGTLKVQYFD